MFNRAEIVDRNFQDFLRGWTAAPSWRAHPDEPVHAGVGLRGTELLELFESQITARHLDLIARTLRARDEAYYTIGSAGHEGNVVLGRLLRPTDPAFLHYRSGALMVERSRQLPGIDPVRDAILSQTASVDDPMGGRHKVWGSGPLWVLPQTSTIASHLPKAVGAAMALSRAKKIGLEPPVPRDSIILCSFGDASTNHKSALGAFNTASWTAYQHVPVPILFVCEDNGLGISVKTPPGYLEREFQGRPALKYFRADGTDLLDAYGATAAAVRYCRERRVPVFLHLKVVRMLGHAGTDVELEYRSVAEVAEAESRDPLLRTARIVLESGLLTAPEILDRYEATRNHVAAVAEQVLSDVERLERPDQVMAPLAPYTPGAVRTEALRDDYHERRLERFGDESAFPENQSPKHLAALINLGLDDLLTRYPHALVFGEDVARKGGVYHVTAGLEKRFRAGRVFNTLLDEESILGLAQGSATMGMLPIPEIQYLAYFHNACDQIRGEACSLQFFSNGTFRNPMVVRIAALAYQKGFGGHFHNDNSITALRDIPGLIVACPSRGDDAVGMLRTCAALAKVDGRVSAFLEPIALYMTKDLYDPKDGGWSFEFPPPDVAVPYGEGRVYDEDAEDIAIITFGNGVYMALRAAHQLELEQGIRSRVLDLRWLTPLNAEWICRNVRGCPRILVVDE
ncbi:MAG: MFS transporter, partial [Candidatus Eisenbacteria bacterium]|nr:MFS transporter [Candidatus Eisenbacteria bacterium]